MQPVYNRSCSAPVSLHHHAKPVPPFQAGVGQGGFDHLERQRQTIRFFGVDVQPKASGACQTGEGAQAGYQFVQHLSAFGDFVAWMQGREFDRNARIGADVGAGGGTGDRGDGLGIS